MRSRGLGVGSSRNQRGIDEEGKEGDNLYTRLIDWRLIGFVTVTSPCNDTVYTLSLLKHHVPSCC